MVIYPFLGLVSWNFDYTYASCLAVTGGVAMVVLVILPSPLRQLY